MSLWDDVKKNLIELYAVTSDRTSELAKITSRKYDKFGISREIERQFSELGNLVYSGLKEGKQAILEDPVLAALIKRVDELEEELRRKDREIHDIRQAHAVRKQAAPETARVLKDPALAEGADASAILLETGAGANGQEDPAGEQEIVEK